MHAREQKLELVSAPTPQPPGQGMAVIAAVAERGFVVDHQGRQLHARRAASCLLEPGVGDRVWIVVEGEHGYVLAVLERAGEGPSTLRVEGDAALRVEGRLELHARDELSLRGDELQVQARAGRVFIQDCKAVLRSLLTHAESSTLVGKLVETLAERVSTSSKTSTRTVTEIDQLHAGIIDHQAAEAAHIAADKVVINGGEIAKVEAGQIHLG